MRILSIGKEITHTGLTIDSITASSLSEHHNIEQYDYVIIHGGDGTIRRVLKQLHSLK
jgi:diacylglycerol kinase family enzyme